MDPILYLNNHFRKLSNYESNEIKNGAYVVIEDRGILYNKHAKEGVKRYWCEHISANTVYDLDGIDDNNVYGNVLIGTGLNGHTWFQWEKSRCFSINHLIDWAKFVYTKKNQGPSGSSDRTEKKPLILRSTLSSTKIKF